MNDDTSSAAPLPRRRVLQGAAAAAALAGAGAATHALAQVSTAAAPATAPAPPAAPPLSAFFNPPSLSAAAMSPDGRAVAMRVAGSGEGEHAVLAVLDLQTMQPTVVASFKDAAVRHFAWVNERRLVLDAESDHSGHGLFAVDRDGTSFRQLVETQWAFARAGGSSGTPELPWNTRMLRTVGTPGSDEVYVVRPEEMSAEKIDYFRLQRLNTRSGRAVEVRTPEHAYDWTFDAQGRLALVSTRRGERVTVHRSEGEQWKAVSEFTLLSKDALAPRHIDAQGTVYAQALSGDKLALYTMDPATGRLSTEPVLASKGFDLHPVVLHDGARVRGWRYTVDAEVTQWLDPQLEALQGTIEGVLKSTVNRLGVPQRGDSPWVLVEAFSDRQPTLTLAFNRESRRFTRLGAARPAIDLRAMGAADFVRIPARDGLEIPCYLTLPPGPKKTGLPMVVLVHGGPWVRGASWQWDAEVQFLASSGYAVLQPEFRGSTGFGDRHFRAGFKQWGLAMQDDLADCAKWAVDKGVADAKRIAIAGASYGGYATVMGLARHPEIFRCGVSWVGVTDPALLHSSTWTDITRDAARHSLNVMLGDPAADAELLKQASALTHASRIRAPLILAYGRQDRRVDLVHGERLRDALRPHNREVEWVVYDDEGHGWWRPKTRLDFWARVEKFLARHLAAG
ncbi:MAG: alpha/beta hydrolase family protein [Rubrivivax sp.]